MHTQQIQASRSHRPARRSTPVRQTRKVGTRWRAAAVAMTVGCTLSACGGGGGGGTTTAATVAPTPASTSAAQTTPVYDFSKFTVCQTSACSTDLVTQFHVDNWFWTASTTYDESVMPITGKTNYGLWMPAVKVETVRNRQTGQIYKSGTDYQFADGQLIIPATSTIPTTPLSWIQTADPTNPPDWSPVTKEGVPLRISNDYQQNQIAVTYTNTAYQPAPPLVSSYPANFIAKLKAGQQVAITIVGDSITAGDNSTGLMGEAPNQPGYIALAIAYLSQLYPGQVYVRNEAVGGYDSASIIATAPSTLADTPSDLVIVGDGMNDMTANVTGAQFAANQQQIIAAARWCNPNTEVVLVSSWPSNSDWALTNNQAFVDYDAANYQVAGTTSGVSVADMTSVVWAGMSNAKSFYDITANGANHPSDFVYVVYAQTLLKTILGM